MLKNLMRNKGQEPGVAMVPAVGGTCVRKNVGPGCRMPALHGRRDARRYGCAT